MNRRESAHKLVAWSAFALLVIAGWFIVPTSTAHFYESGGAVHQVDLISFQKEGSASPDVHKDAYMRAVLLVVCTFLGSLMWWMAFTYVCLSGKFSKDDPLTLAEFLPLAFLSVLAGIALVTVVCCVVFA